MGRSTIRNIAADTNQTAAASTAIVDSPATTALVGGRTAARKPIANPCNR